MNAAQRTELKKLMDYLYTHRDRVHYPHNDVRVESIHDVRTFYQVKVLVESPSGLVIDCSQMDELLLNVVLGHSWSGYHFDASTKEFLDKLPHYTAPSAAYVGGLVVFGGGTGHHMAMVYERGKNPLLFSHGQEADPRLIRLSDEAAGQAANGHHGYTFLSIAHL